MAALLCLLLSLRAQAVPRLLFWFASALGLGVLGVDEIFRLHEQLGKHVGNDDHLKTAQWFLAGAALWLLYRLEQPGRAVLIFLTCGYLLHLLYLLTDVGDGDYFTIGFATEVQLKWAEELLELAAMSLYCMGLIWLVRQRLGGSVSPP